MKPFLQIEREGAVITARMDRPESRNALTEPEYFQEFVDLCQQIRIDTSIKVLIYEHSLINKMSITPF